MGAAGRGCGIIVRYVRQAPGKDMDTVGAWSRRYAARCANGALFADEQTADLLGAMVPQFENPQEHSWQEVKWNSKRAVYHKSLFGKEIYLKHFCDGSFLRRLVRRLKPSPAKREFVLSLYLRSRGVPATPVFAAQWTGPRRWVAAWAVAGAVQGDSWHRDQLLAGDGGRRKIALASAALARLIADMHRAGVIHRDLHCGNVLVRRRADEHGRLEAVLVDLHRVTRHARLSRRMRAANIAQLCHDRAGSTTLTERIRFLRQYLDFSGEGGTVRGWQRMISLHLRRHARRQYAHLDGRVYRRNRYFAPLRLAGGWCGQAVLRLKSPADCSGTSRTVASLEDWRAALDRSDILAARPSGPVVKDSRSAMVVKRELVLGEQMLEVFVKRPRRDRWWSLSADCFRRCRCQRAFKLGHMLLARGFSTALPLAALRRRRCGILLDSALVTEVVKGQGLEEFFRVFLSPCVETEPAFAPARRQRLAQRLLWDLGRMLRLLHEAGFRHRDLKAANILVQAAQSKTGIQRAAARCWALLLVRIYECLPLLCPRCGEPMRIIAFVLDPPVIERILDHIGEPQQPPIVLPARSPPQAEMDFDQVAGSDEWPEMDQTVGADDDTWD